jgi:hypothetical protein
MDEALISAIKTSCQTTILGVSARKLKSLKFRVRRRDLKVRQSGTPFNVRESLKNTNRRTAALQRKRDGNGKFLNIPIYPKKVAHSSKQCQIFA